MSPRAIAALEGGRDLLCGIDHDADQRCVRGLDAAVGDHLDQPFGDARAVWRPGRRHASGRSTTDRRPWRGCRVRRSPCRNGRDWKSPPWRRRRSRWPTAVKPSWTRTMMPWICCGAFAGALGPQRGVAALADQAADLAVEIANGIADQMGRLARRFGEALHLAGDDRKASSRGAGARGLDGGVQRQQIGLLARSPRSIRIPWRPAPARCRPNRADARCGRRLRSVRRYAAPRSRPRRATG